MRGVFFSFCLVACCACRDVGRCACASVSVLCVFVCLCVLTVILSFCPVCIFSTQAVVVVPPDVAP